MMEPPPATNPPPRGRLAALWGRLSWWLLSVPIFIKILGLCTAVAWLFGVVVLVQTHGNMSRILRQLLDRQTAIETAWVESGRREGVPPIVAGDAASLKQMVDHELSGIIYTIIWTFMLCVAVGTVLALLYTYFVVTRPIYHLVQAVRGIETGDFQGRVRILSGDEIGRLAQAFNAMAASLERSRRQIREKEQARLNLLDKLVDAQEEERKTISRELHDQIGQSLLALLLALQTGPAAESLPAALREDLEGRLRHLVDKVRLLAWGMRPSILDDYGLEVALERYIETVARHYQCAIDYHPMRSAGQGRLPGRIEVTLYRVAQEAVMNILTHARATRCGIVLLHQPRRVVLLIEDNGCGFDVSRTIDHEHGSLGLRGMAERVALHGGEWVCESSPGQGTTVRVTIPLEEVPS